MRRALVLTAAIGTVALVAAPAVLGHDSFPLSDYPMFADDRGRESVIATAVGVTPAGRRERLSPELIGGTDEPIHAATTAQRAVATAAGAASLCDAVAARAAGRAELVAIEVVSERYDTVGFLAGERAPAAVTVHARCPVARR